MTGQSRNQETHVQAGSNGGLGMGGSNGGDEKQCGLRYTLKTEGKRGLWPE